MWRLAVLALLAELTGCDRVLGLSRSGSDAGTTDASADASADDCADPTLRLCMTFEDELGGQTSDRSAENNHATVANVAAAGRGPERAVRVSAVSQIAIAEDSSLDVTLPATFSAWVFLDAAPMAGTGMIVLDNDFQYAILMDDNSGAKCSVFLSAVGIVEVRQTITLQAWHHVACVYAQGASNPALTMYIDGEDVGSTPGTGPIATAGTAGMHIGQNSGGGGLESGPLSGMVDNVRIWARALSAAEITSLATSD